MKKLIIITGAALLAILMIKSIKASSQQPSQQPSQQEISQGKIINTETNIVGDCTDNNCLINKDLLVYSTFKNIGTQTITNQVGIKINDTIVKSEYVTVNPNQEYIMIYNTQLNTEKLYNVCGVVIQ